MLELAVLGLLKEQPMHGYHLSRELTDSLGGLWRVSYGSLYPTLRRLERDGAIESEAGDERGARRKKVYRITETGEAMFLDLLQEAPQEGQAEDARFRMRLAFFRYLAPETRIRLLERRRQALQRRLSAVSASLRANREIDDYGAALIEHNRATIGSDISWLDGLIAAERRKSAAASGLHRRRTALRGGSSSGAVARGKEKVS